MSDYISITEYFEKEACTTNINYDHPHYVASIPWENTLLYGVGFKRKNNDSTTIEEFSNYKEACESVQANFYGYDLYNEGEIEISWMIIDLVTLEVTNYNNTNRMDEFYQKEEEYKNEFALAIEKVKKVKTFWRAKHLL
jgi:hypothetical protein